jgi:CMP-2-keto-3-deoxyoctulosonic acid synthetase
VQVASLMKKISKEEDFNNPNIVKLVVDKNKDALYFSRAAIPFNRDSGEINTAFEHIGIYAFRKKALLAFTTWPMSQLEKIEKLEQLRYLENGIKIRMVETDIDMIKIDVPKDLEKAEDFLRKV